MKNKLETGRDELLRQTAALVQSAAEKCKADSPLVFSGRNPSTSVDMAISQHLKERLPKVYNAPIISEEDHSQVILGKEHSWLVDPLDGTLNFICGSPDYCISVALVDESCTPILAVVYQPANNYLLTSIKNRGYQLNRKTQRAPLHSQNIVSYGLPDDVYKDYSNTAKGLESLIRNGVILRQSGSACIDICRVATGTWRAFFEKNLYIWDCIAADLILKEAGYFSYLNIKDSFRCDYIAAGSETELNKLKITLNW